MEMGDGWLVSFQIKMLTLLVLLPELVREWCVNEIFKCPEVIIMEKCHKRAVVTFISHKFPCFHAGDL